jgi:hypothetical protein
MQLWNRHGCPGHPAGGTAICSFRTLAEDSLQRSIQEAGLAIELKANSRSRRFRRRNPSRAARSGAVRSASCEHPSEKKHVTIELQAF